MPNLHKSMKLIGSVLLIVRYYLCIRWPFFF